MNHLTTTHHHALADHYARPGGPWDVATLPGVLRGPGDRASGRAGSAHDVLVDGDIRLTADDLDDLTVCLAGGLRDAGITRGDAVAWQLHNGYEAILLFRACWQLGAIAVPIHHMAGEAEACAILDQVEPVVLVAAAALPLGQRPEAVVVGGPSLPTRSSPEPIRPRPLAPVKHFAKMLTAEPELESAATPSDIAVVLFTAGSSGEPKGVLHTHRCLAAKALQMPAVHGLDDSDAVLMPAPLAHISGLLNGILVPEAAGMKTVLMPKWNPALALDLIERERITFMVGPPTFFLGLMHDPSFTARRVRSLRLVSTGGAGITTAFVDKATDALGATVKRSYGSTEAPTVTTSTPADDSHHSTHTDGRAVGEVELRIVDPSTGTDRTAGGEGELWVRGPELFAGYLDATLTERAVTPDGWFRTGDLATVDADGWLTVTGRLKDIIIRGGENIAAGEVESVLEAHPDIRVAVAIGEPDDRLGERVVAFVVGPDDFDLAACRAWFAKQGVAKFKTPERVIVVDSIPILPAGKTDRGALRRSLVT